jgi:hypothetical protein
MKKFKARKEKCPRAVFHLGRGETQQWPNFQKRKEFQSGRQEPGCFTDCPFPIHQVKRFHCGIFVTNVLLSQLRFLVLYMTHGKLRNKLDFKLKVTHQVVFFYICVKHSCWVPRGRLLPWDKRPCKSPHGSCLLQGQRRGGTNGDKGLTSPGYCRLIHNCLFNTFFLAFTICEALWFFKAILVIGN